MEHTCRFRFKRQFSLVSKCQNKIISVIGAGIVMGGVVKYNNVNYSSNYSMTRIFSTLPLDSTSFSNADKRQPVKRWYSSFDRIELPSDVKPVKAAFTEKDQQDFETSKIYNKQTQLKDVSKSTQKLKVILDVDTGIDDSHAIMLALAHPNVEVIAITCVNGNVNVDLVCENTLRVLNACGRDDIPVYRGADRSLLGNISQWENFSGEAWNCPVDTTVLQSEHAANALIRIVNDMPGEVTVVALAPLTNLALAMRLDSTVGHKIKELYIMGGNIEARGRISTCAEFNFYNDPEAAQVVLNEFSNITILPYEICGKLLPWEFFDQWIDAGTPVSDFVKRSVLDSVKPARAAGRGGYRSCDGYAMALVVDQSVVKKTEQVYATVEVNGQLTRGQMVVDWYSVLKKPYNALLVKDIDIEKIKSLFMMMVTPGVSKDLNNNHTDVSTTTHSSSNDKVS